MKYTWKLKIHLLFAHNKFNTNAALMKLSHYIVLFTATADLMYKYLTGKC